MKFTPVRYIALLLSTLTFASPLKAAPLTTEEVGDVGSFGHAALYMGAKSGFIRLRNPADPEPCPAPDPSSLCMDLAPSPATTSFSAPNIMTISLPKKATRTMIYPALNFFLSYELSNPTAPRQDGHFTFNATVSIESAVLLDPAIVDPNTGDPLNGVLTGQFGYVYNDNRSMDTLDRQRTRITLTRVGNTGITKEQLIGQGYSPAVVDALFNNPMKVRMSVTGSAKLATDVNLTANMRLFGD